MPWHKMPPIMIKPLREQSLVVLDDTDRYSDTRSVSFIERRCSYRLYSDQNGCSTMTCRQILSTPIHHHTTPHYTIQGPLPIPPRWNRASISQKYSPSNISVTTFHTPTTCPYHGRKNLTTETPVSLYGSFLLTLPSVSVPSLLRGPAPSSRQPEPEPASHSIRDRPSESACPWPLRNCCSRSATAKGRASAQRRRVVACRAAGLATGTAI